MKEHLWFIHGNLQQPTVWDALTVDLSSNYIIHKENLWITTQEGFWSWATDFCKRVTEIDPNAKHHLVGYSLGGRLAMHAVLHAPELWQSAIIIASDTGLSGDVAKTKQLAWDKAWGQRFLLEDWNSLITEWNQLSVFQDFKNPNPPQEKDFSREAIARCFKRFSKGHQDDLLPLLTKMRQAPISYITGKSDRKYSEKGEVLARAHPQIQHHIIKNAAHRVPWENPESFKTLLSSLLKEYSN